MTTIRKLPSPTPGPWVPERESGLRWRIRTAGDKGTLAYMTARPMSWGANFSHEQIAANARLIAAAPDLLAFAESVVTLLADAYPKAGLHLDMDKASLLNAAREVVKKARGE